MLAWQLDRTDDATWTGVRKAAEALVREGPATPQERWEESGGFSNSTTPSEIAGLVAAADLARRRGDRARAALWMGVADLWQRSTEDWMFTTTGPLGDGRYYVRIDDDGDPDDGSERDFGNAAGVHRENEVVDAGFLELVRLGVKAPNDPYVAASLPETDESIATDTPSGRVWHRYTFDGYGEKDDGSPWTFNTAGTEGRAWPLLSGERGEYEVANGRDGLSFLTTMANTANDGFMIPEQVWDEPTPAPAPYNYQPGKATGSASPLAWAMAQYVRLACAIEAGRPVETPQVVRRRYATGERRQVPALSIRSPQDRSLADSRQVTVRGTTDVERVYVGVGSRVEEAIVRDGTFEATVPLERGRNKITAVAQGEDGGTNMRQVTVVAFGTRVGGLTDPDGDDNGPGTYRYPTNPVYAPGIFDLQNLDVFVDGDDALFVMRIRGPVQNQFGGEGISHQKLNVYLGGGAGAPAAGSARYQRRHRIGVDDGGRGRWPIRPGRRLRAHRGKGGRRDDPHRPRDPADRDRGATVRARCGRPAHSALRRRNARQRRGGRGHRLHQAGLRLQLLEQPAGRNGLGQRVPFRRRRRPDRLLAAQQGHRHARPEHDRRHRRR